MSDILTVETPVTGTVQATITPTALIGEAESDALSGTGASLQIWIVIYILLVAVLILGGYLVTQYVSYHNAAAQGILIPVALYVAGLFTPAGKIASAAVGK